MAAAPWRCSTMAMWISDGEDFYPLERCRLAMDTESLVGGVEMGSGALDLCSAVWRSWRGATWMWTRSRSSKSLDECCTKNKNPISHLNVRRQHLVDILLAGILICFSLTSQSNHLFLSNPPSAYWLIIRASMPSRGRSFLGTGTSCEGKFFSGHTRIQPRRRKNNQKERVSKTLDKNNKIIRAQETIKIQSP